MATIDKFNINGTNYDLRDNSKVATNQGVENAGKALVVASDGSVALGEAGVPAAVSVALLQCFQHVAWADASGQECYDALYEALNGGEPPVPEPEYVWRYTPADGLLSAQSYTTKAQAAGYAGGEEYIDNGVLVLADENHSEGLGSVNTAYRFMDSHTNKGRLKVRFKCEKPYIVATADADRDGMGICFILSNGTAGCRVAINTLQNGDGELRAMWLEGQSVGHVVNTGLFADEYHTIELIIDGNHQTIKLDDAVIADHDGLNTSWTTNTTILQQARGSSLSGFPYNGLETHIDWIEYYDDDE